MSAPRSRRLALGVLATGALMTILDGSIVTVAMPAIQRDLRFSPAGLSWVVNAYLIAFGSLLLLAGDSVTWSGAGRCSSVAPRCSPPPPCWPGWRRTAPRSSRPAASRASAARRPRR
nr:hypothetical protein [Micromonospora provocatoris]